MGGRVNNVCGWGAGKRRAFVQPSSLDNVFDMCIRQASGSDRESNGVGGWEGHADPFWLLWSSSASCSAQLLCSSLVWRRVHIPQHRRERVPGRAGR